MNAYEKPLSLGIDTSNYKTSVAVTDRNGVIIRDCRSFLYVKKGERGLRQSDALFQHVRILPRLIEEALDDPSIRKNIGCVSASSRPRPVEGSYMPVFTAGVSAGEMIASSLGVPFYTFSHQEGHIEAASYYCGENPSRFVSFHFSGGTTEALLVTRDETGADFEIVGGSKDISFGQLLDRAGVSMGFDFPCGQVMDDLACEACESLQKEASGIFTPIKVKDGYVNLSGTETQAMKAAGRFDSRIVSLGLLATVASSIEKITLQLAEKYEPEIFIFAGGVSSSRFIRQYLGKNKRQDIKLVFSDPGLASDNAVGTALLGGKKYGAETGNGNTAK